MRQMIRSNRSGLRHVMAGILGIAMLLGLGALSAIGGKGNGGKGGGGGGGGGGGSFPSFRVVDLGLGGRAEAVNDVGEVAGAINNHAAYWRVDNAGTVQTTMLPEPNGFQSSAEDVNNFGEVVGAEWRTNVAGSSFPIALLWKVSQTGVTTVVLPPLAGDTDSHAYAVSDTGLIVGSSQAYDADGGFVGGSAVVWQVDDDNNVRVVELPSSSTDAVAIDVNNLGQVLGRDGYGADSRGVWQLQSDADGRVTGAVATATLPTLGGTGIELGSIKDTGEIVGGADTANGEMHAVIWQIDGQGDLVGITDLGALAGKSDLAAAKEVNGLGWAVGNACSLSVRGGNIRLDCAPFLWKEGEMAKLNELLSDNGGFKDLWPVLGMNESGWICGRGSKSRQTHGYVAIPVAP